VRSDLQLDQGCMSAWCEILCKEVITKGVKLIPQALQCAQVSVRPRLFLNLFLLIALQNALPCG